MATAPIAIMKYLQPKFSDFVQTFFGCPFAAGSHVWYPSSGHAIKPANSCAKAQKTDRTVRRYWCEPGKNSRKMAESTGRFPPTPTLQNAAKTAIAAKFGDPAAINPKTEVIPIVRLKAHRRPKTSPDRCQRYTLFMKGNHTAKAPEYSAHEESDVLR